MISFTIKTWRCKECGYAQDFEPTAENLAIHFKGLGLEDDQCPACTLGQNPTHIKSNDSKMARVTDPKMKSVMNCCEESDVIAKRAELENAPPAKTMVKEVVVEETQEQREERIEMDMGGMRWKSPEEIAEMRAKYED